MRRYRLDLTAVAMFLMTSSVVAFFTAALPVLRRPYSDGFANPWVWLVLGLFAAGFGMIAFVVWPRRLRLAPSPDLGNRVQGPQVYNLTNYGPVYLSTLQIKNESSVEVSLVAKVRQGVTGIAPDPYGNFELGWDGDSKECILNRHDHWKLHVAYIFVDQVSMCFVKPDGSVYDLLRLTADEPVRFVVDITETGSRKRKSIPVELGFESVPTTSFRGEPATTWEPFIRLAPDQ